MPAQIYRYPKTIVPDPDCYALYAKLPEQRPDLIPLLAV